MCGLSAESTQTLQLASDRLDLYTTRISDETIRQTYRTAIIDHQRLQQRLTQTN